MRDIKTLIEILVNEYLEIEKKLVRSYKELYNTPGYGFGNITKEAVKKGLLTDNERDRLLTYLRTNKNESVNQLLWWPMGYLNAERIEFLNKLIAEL